MPTQTLMTIAEFAAWMVAQKSRVKVWPYHIVPCRCGDLNCHGWRLVAA